MAGTPENNLASALIQMALDDSLAEHNTPTRASARAFLTDRGGEWAAQRKFWCDVAGFDPDAVRDRTTVKIMAANTATLTAAA